MRVEGGTKCLPPVDVFIPIPDGEFGDLVGNICHLESTHGIAYTRDREPMIRARETRRSVIYPSVLWVEQRYTISAWFKSTAFRQIQISSPIKTEIE